MTFGAGCRDAAACGGDINGGEGYKTKRIPDWASPRPLVGAVPRTALVGGLYA